MKKFFGIDDLPTGHASDALTHGCIVLEGGAFRVLYSEGVLDALMQADINMDCTIGVSGGAINGVSYTMGQIGRSALLNLKYRHDPEYVGFHTQNTGIIGLDFVFKGRFAQEYPWDYDTFYKKERRFVVVCTDVETGQATYFEKSRCDDILKAVEASASMPYVSKPVEVQGGLYLDGGCSVKIPVQWAIDQGYEKIIVVRTRPRSYRKNSRSMALVNRLFYKDYPLFQKQLDTSNRRYNEECDRIDQLTDRGRIFTIYPSEPITISRLETDMDKLGQLYYLGYEDAKGQLAKLKTYLEATK